MPQSFTYIAFVLQFAALVSCTRGGFLKAPKPDDAAGVGDFTNDMHFLLVPSDAESLLGRQVFVSPKGEWTLADERAPGCEVQVQRSSATYNKQHQIGLGDLTSISGGYKQVLNLEARYGRSIEAEFKIENTEVLTAKVTGPCGDKIVKSVRVGKGFRKLVRKAEAGAKSRIGKGPLGAEGGREAATEVLDSIEWSEPQAYAFSYESVGPTPPVSRFCNTTVPEDTNVPPSAEYSSKLCTPEPGPYRFVLEGADDLRQYRLRICRQGKKFPVRCEGKENTVLDEGGCIEVSRQETPAAAGRIIGGSVCVMAPLDDTYIRIDNVSKDPLVLKKSFKMYLEKI